MKKHSALSFFIFFLSATALAQSQQLLTIRKYSSGNVKAMMEEFTSFLTLSNVAANLEGQQKNSAFIMNMMTARGIKNVQLLNATTANVPPVVYGEALTPGATQTLIFYAHYDGQPVNAAQWKKGLNPFIPVLYSNALYKGGELITAPADGNYNNDWRIYARSSSDDKAGIAAILNAYEAISKSALAPKYNLKFFFEGEEEAGSPHLDEILKKYKSLLQSDLWIICDGPIHQSGKKQLFFGVRGDAHLDLTVYACKRPLHSGHYGNWAPNPAMMLVKLLASMKDDNGKVTIKGFYDDVTPLTTAERKALDDVPNVDEQLKDELGITTTDMKGLSLSEAINQPSLNINGIQSGNVGKLASNQIPTYATAVIDLRLVMGNDWKRQQQKVIDHIKAQGYFVTNQEPTDEERKLHAKIIKVIVGNDGTNAQRTSMDLPIIKKTIAAVRAITKEKVVLQPTMGGTLPLFLFEKYLNAKTITIPIANYDNNQHAENENIRLGNLFDGIETMASLMLME